jgi:circadian clock protein KaiC
VSLLPTVELPDLFQATRLSELGVSHVSDNVVLLQYVHQAATICRTLTVVKPAPACINPKSANSPSPPNGITLKDEAPIDPASGS